MAVRRKPLSITPPGFPDGPDHAGFFRHVLESALERQPGIIRGTAAGILATSWRLEPRLFGRWSQCRMAAACHFMVNDAKLPQYRPSRAFRFKAMKMRMCFACMSAVVLVIAASGVARGDEACGFDVRGWGRGGNVGDDGVLITGD